MRAYTSFILQDTSVSLIDEYLESILSDGLVRTVELAARNKTRELVDPETGHSLVYIAKWVYFAHVVCSLPIEMCLSPSRRRAAERFLQAEVLARNGFKELPHEILEAQEALKTAHEITSP